MFSRLLLGCMHCSQKKRNGVMSLSCAKIKKDLLYKTQYVRRCAFFQMSRWVIFFVDHGKIENQKDDGF